VNYCLTINQSALSDPLQNIFLTVDIAETVLATRGFRHSAVAVWNSLPDSVRDSSNIDIFKRKSGITYAITLNTTAAGVLPLTGCH
jgi:hypothetical protein